MEAHSITALAQRLTRAVTKERAYELTLALLAKAKLELNDPRALIGFGPQLLPRLTSYLAELSGFVVSQMDDGALLRESEALAKQIIYTEHTLRSRAEDWFPSIDGSFSVMPRELVDVVCALAELKAGEHVYVPWDPLGQLSSLAGAHQTKVLVQNQVKTTVLTSIQVLTDQCLQTEFGNPIANDSEIRSGWGPKAALAFPPFGMGMNELQFYRNAERFANGKETFSVLVIRHLIRTGAERIVVVIPSGLLSSKGSEKKLRDELIDSHDVRAVIDLPPGLVGSVANKFSVLLIDKTQDRRAVRFIDAASPAFAEQSSKARVHLTNVKRLVSTVLHAPGMEAEHSRTISWGEIHAEGNSLLPKRYLVAPAKLLSDGGVLFKLSEAATVVRPIRYSELKSVETDNSDGHLVAEVGAQDLPSYGSVRKVSKTLKISPHVLEKYSRFALQPLDVVVVVKGSVGKVGILSEALGTAAAQQFFAGQSLVALRVKQHQKLRPEALYMFLRSPIGQAWLTKLVTGTATPLIQTQELLEMPITEALIANQLHAVDLFKQEESLQDQLDLLQAKQAALASKLWHANM